MKTYLIQHDYTKSQPRLLNPVFGNRNEGFTSKGNTEREAINNWNKSQLPGNRLNPFYLKITEVKQ